MQNRRRNSWTEEEDQILVENVSDSTYKELRDMLPRRSISSIHSRCRFLGLSRAEEIERAKEEKAPEELMQQEKEIIVEELEFFLPLVCTEIKQEREALTLLKMLKEANAPRWWWDKRKMKLGHWGEMFIRNYKYIPKELIRDEFLNSDGLFMELNISEFYEIEL